MIMIVFPFAILILKITFGVEYKYLNIYEIALRK